MRWFWNKKKQENKKKKTIKVTYMVQCAYDENHKFEKVFEIEEGTEQTFSNVQAYCPECDKMVEVTVQGKVIPDENILRMFEELKQQI